MDSIKILEPIATIDSNTGTVDSVDSVAKTFQAARLTHEVARGVDESMTVNGFRLSRETSDCEELNQLTRTKPDKISKHMRKRQTYWYSI